MKKAQSMPALLLATLLSFSPTSPGETEFQVVDYPKLKNIIKKLGGKKIIEIHTISNKVVVHMNVSGKVQLFKIGPMSNRLQAAEELCEAFSPLVRTSGGDTPILCKTR